MAVAAHLAF